jgi:hypothetical protein
MDQIRVPGSEGILTRSRIKPQRRSCSSAPMPEYSLKACANRAKSASINFARRSSNRTVMKKYRFERKGRRSFDTALEYDTARMMVSEKTCSSRGAWKYTMRRLNGWKRIGIVASVAWILGAGIYTYNSEIDEASRFIVSTHVACDAGLKGRTGDAWTAGFDECNKQADHSLALASTNARLEAALVAFVPVPFAWGAAYLLLFLVRWIGKGFVASSR